MPNNCLVTRYKGALDVDSLPYWEKLIIHVKITGDNKQRLTEAFRYSQSNKGNYKIIGNGQILDRNGNPIGKELLNVGDDAYYYFLGPGEYDLELDKYKIISLILAKDNTSIKLSTKGTHLTYLTSLTNLQIGNTHVMNEHVDGDSFHASSFSILNLSNVNITLHLSNINISNILTMSLSNTPGITGSLLPIANSNLTSIYLTGDLEIDEFTIEEFVTKMRTDAPSKTSINFSIWETTWTGVTIGGNPMKDLLLVSGAAAGIGTISWTSNTITVSDKNGLVLYTANV